MTTKQDIRDWIEIGKTEENATHLLVVCDTFDWDDFPIFAESKEDAEQKYDHYNDGENMSRVMEVYDLSMDIEEQLNQHRVFNF